MEYGLNSGNTGYFKVLIQWEPDTLIVRPTLSEKLFPVYRVGIMMVSKEAVFFFLISFMYKLEYIEHKHEKK